MLEIHFSCYVSVFTYVYTIAAILYSMGGIFMMIPLTPIFLDIVCPLNETRPRFLLVIVDWGINQERYFVPIYCYIVGQIVMGIIVVAGVDAMHVNCTAHACSLFLIIG